MSSLVATANATLPSISSGELFFRTQQDDPSSWLAGTLGGELRAFLGADAQADDAATSDFEARRAMLDDAERLALECHRSMCRALEIHTLSAEQLCRSFLSRSKTTDTGFRRGLTELLDEYDDRCARLTVWYYAALEREQEIYRRRMEEESLACARLSFQVKESLRLSVFAIHLESETDSQILLKRLPSAHPQHVRCRRAASENIKPGFFEGACEPFTGINVLDVYKVENAPELDRFQKRAAAMEPGKVKGLFTSVKGTSIERIIALGMGPSGDGSGAGSIATEGARLERERKALFRRAWYAYHNNKSEVGYAENRIGKSQGCHFPRSFSRYSTLESDRDHVEAAARGFLESTRSSSASGGGGSEGGHGSVAGAPGSGTIPPSLKDGGGPITDDIRYLVLCRVAVGKVFVTSKEYKGFPSVGNDPAFDSMYNPLQEEYLVLRPDQVLPEFIIQYVFKKLPSSAVSAKMAGKMAAASSSSMNTGSSSSASASLPLMPIDLSTPHVNLGPGDNPWQVPVASHSKKSSASTEVSVLVDPLPTRDAGRKSRMPTAFKDLNQSEDDKKSGSISISDSTGSSWMENDAARSAHAVEVMRREQQTSWEQLRLNGARQRETILERCGALVKTYRKHSAKLRGWERLRLREPVQDQPPLQTVEMVRSEVDTAESELSRQTMRRREMESEMNALKKRASRREESENRYGRRR